MRAYAPLMDRHDRYAQLALSHVLGGLGRGDADDFRTHLRGCEDCRARVAELRGISSTLDAAAREERRRAADGPPERRAPGTGEVRRGPGRLAVVAASLAVVLLFGFWNLHLRTSADAYFTVAEERGAILRDLGAGTLLDDPSFASVGARVGLSGTRIVLVIADGGPLGSDERLVAWLEPLGSSTDEAVVLSVGPRSSTEVAYRLERGSAMELVVTREVGLLSSSGPRGAEVLRVRLPSTGPGT
jgi:hypothetical protein